MPRNVVTLIPRQLVLPTRNNDDRRQQVVAAIHTHFRPQQSQSASWEIHFPNSLGKRTAREQVIEVLTAAEPRWRALLVLYPKASVL